MRVDDGLARLVLNAAFAKLDRHLAVLLALEETDAGDVIDGECRTDRGRDVFLLANPFGEALAVFVGFWRRWFGDCDGVSVPAVGDGGSGFC